MTWLKYAADWSTRGDLQCQTSSRRGFSVMRREISRVQIPSVACNDRSRSHEVFGRREVQVWKDGRGIHYFVRPTSASILSICGAKPASSVSTFSWVQYKGLEMFQSVRKCMVPFCQEWDQRQQTRGEESTLKSHSEELFPPLSWRELQPQFKGLHVKRSLKGCAACYYLFGCAGGGGHSESHACTKGRAIPVSAGMVWLLDAISTPPLWLLRHASKFSELPFLTLLASENQKSTPMCRHFRTSRGAWQLKTNIEKLTCQEKMPSHRESFWGHFNSLSFLQEKLQGWNVETGLMAYVAGLCFMCQQVDTSCTQSDLL